MPLPTATDALIDRLKAGELVRSWDIDGRLLAAALASGRVVADPASCALVAGITFEVALIDRRWNSVSRPRLYAFDAGHAVEEALRIFRWGDPAPQMIEPWDVRRISAPRYVERAAEAAA